ncbi:hypothetical protein LPJ54_005171 [Coemansia sp. RSA 1824]|nr:hypothetical protein LPJ54_005171 [Coemansia sp. RSA 1824]
MAQRNNTEMRRCARAWLCLPLGAAVWSSILAYIPRCCLVPALKGRLPASGQPAVAPKLRLALFGSSAVDAGWAGYCKHDAMRQHLRKHSVVTRFWAKRGALIYCCVADAVAAAGSSAAAGLPRSVRHFSPAASPGRA